MKRIALPAAAAAALFIGAAWWIALSQTAMPPERSPDVAPGTPASAATYGNPVAAPSAGAYGAPGAAATRASRSDLRDEIRDGRDLRSYYERTKNMADATGERSYRLAEAIAECIPFVDAPYDDLSKRLAVKKEALDSSRRQEIFTFMYERCKGFSGNSAAMTGFISALHKHAEFAAYPAAIARSLRDPGRRDPERADDIATSLLSGPSIDPDVVHELAEYVAMRTRHLSARHTADAQARAIAWGLLECDYGADCGPRSRPVVMTCIAFGACDLQRVEDAVAAQGSQFVFEKAAAIRQQLHRQIAAHDWYGVGFVRLSFDPPGASK